MSVTMKKNTHILLVMHGCTHVRARTADAPKGVAGSAVVRDE